MGKDWQERLTDTLNFIEENAKQTHDEVSKVLKAKFKELSVGAWNSKSKEKEARRAKRALLLATRLFLTNKTYLKAEMERVLALPETSEKDLLAEYLSWFATDKVKPSAVAKLAVENIGSMPNWDNLQCRASKMVRGAYDKTHKFNCYNGVVFWAFQAGAISRRFLFNKWEGLDGQAAFPIFSKCGWTTVIKWKVDEKDKSIKTVTDLSKGGEIDVPVGHAVYFVTPHKVFGHVAMSIGNGEIISQNAVTPAKADKIEKRYKKALDQMNKAVTHVISIRNFIDIHYHPENGYFELQYTTKPFWEAYDLAER
jgi:hypothetical protein